MNKSCNAVLVYETSPRLTFCLCLIAHLLGMQRCQVADSTHQYVSKVAEFHLDSIQRSSQYHRNSTTLVAQGGVDVSLVLPSVVTTVSSRTVKYVEGLSFAALRLSVLGECRPGDADSTAVDFSASGVGGLDVLTSSQEQSSQTHHGLAVASGIFCLSPSILSSIIEISASMKMIFSSSSCS